MNRIAPFSFLSCLQQAFQPLLEVASVLGARDQGAQVQRVDGGVLEHVRHLFVHDQLGQTLGDGGLAHAGLAHVERVVLAAAAQHLDRPLHLVAPADQRVDQPLLGPLVEIGGEALQGALGSRVCGSFVFGLGAQALTAGGVLLVTRDLGNAVGDEIHHVQARHALLVQEVDGLGLLLAEDRHQHIGAGDFALAGGLDVQNRPLEHALETQGGLRFSGIVRRQKRRGFIQEALEIPLQLVKIGPARLEHIHRGGIIRQGEQQVLHGEKLMPFLPRLLESKVQGELQFFAEHSFSPHGLRRKIGAISQCRWT